MGITSSETGTAYWDFGDGEKDTLSGATADHTYATAGNYTVTVILRNQCGADTVDMNITVPNNLSVGAQLDKALKVAFMPNPAHDKVHIRLEGWKNNTVNMELYNIVGGLVKKAALQTTAANEIALADLPPGIYLYKITGERGQQSVGRFIID